MPEETSNTKQDTKPSNAPKTIGLVALLQRKLQNSEAVSVPDVLKLCGLVTHNAQVMNNLVDKVDVLESHILAATSPQTVAQTEAHVADEYMGLRRIVVVLQGKPTIVYVPL